LISRVAIFGAGIMGSSITIALAKQGIKVIVISQYDKDKIFKTIEPKLNNSIKKGNLYQGEKETILSNIIGTTDWELSASVDLIIESIKEDLEEKRKLFSKISFICPNEVIFATNTSSLKISEIALSTGRQEKFIGLHFFNPADRITLVEVVRIRQTSNDTLHEVLNFLTQVNKEPVIVPDIPGFILNHLLVLMINEAIEMVHKNIASPQDIDKITLLGANHPIGPLALADLIGLDTLLVITKNLHKCFGLKYKPSQLLEEMVRDGKLGKKVGEGFYKYLG
jgi:3-hydroxybutyryl-CoA dehydrogenase